MEDYLTRLGKLTIFLGASFGVGKTYTMLEAAYEQQSQGVDVCIGRLDYNRSEFDFFVKNIPGIDNTISTQVKDIENNIDAIIERKPHLVVIDNLASSNPKGQRHAARYRDVEEILQRGINVFTTLNIYQVESLKDIAEQITGLKVADTVPDRLLNIAEIKLIDISHEELLLRLKTGKVILPDNADQNPEKFFRLGNVSALRELALRYTAQRVDQQLNDYMKTHEIKGPWPAGERILACVGPSPFSAHVIRTSRRLADAFKAEWCAVYVETQQRSPGDEKGYYQLDSNLRLAESLGAEIITLTGENVANELLAIAERKNITQIVIGKPLHSKIIELWKGSVVDNVVKGSQGINVHIITGGPTSDTKSAHQKNQEHKIGLFPYLLTIVAVTLITLINMFIGFDLLNIGLLYLLPVLFSAAYWGRGPSILASVLGVLSFDVFFVPPVSSITVHDLKYLLSFAIFLLVAVMTGTMANRLRAQAETARRREARMAALYALSRKIVVETDIDGILSTVVNVIAETIDGEAAIMLPNQSGVLECKSFSTTIAKKENWVDEEIVCWVFEHGKIAGNGSETWGEKDCLYIPLKTEEKNIGVLTVKSNHHNHFLSTEQSQLLEAFANLTALSVISLQLSAEAQQARYFVKSEKLRTALFNSISHELRTPLASIMGAVTSLLDEGELYNKADRDALLLTVNEGTIRMNRLVGNLLDMARLESGMMQLKNEWCDIQEIIGVALQRSNPTLQDRKVSLSIEEDIALIRADFVLIEQVIINLLENANKYSPSDTEISIIATKVNNELHVRIINEGYPIPESDREKIFDKFYRSITSQHITGTGLGLSICKGIIEAHGGQIWVEKEEEKVVFCFSLPIILLPPEILCGKDGE